MRVLARLGIAVLLLAAPAVTEAAPILVAEFRWDADLIDPGVACDGDPACDPVAPTWLSTYSLTGLWDAVSLPPILTGTVTLATGTTFDWLPLSFDTGYFDQLGIAEILPASALTTIFFDFDGETRSLSGLLAGPGAVALSFDPGDPTAPAPVPEPGTITLFGAGLASLIHRAVRRQRRSA